MAQDIDLLGAVYPDVPAVELPKDGGGTALFTDVSDTTADASDVADGEYFYTSAGLRSLGTGKYAAAPVANGNSTTANAILYGNVNSTSTATVFTATVAGLTSLYDGVCVMLHNGVVTSASGFTVNINGLGAKKCYNNMTNATQDTTIFNASYTMMFVYSSALDSGNGGWWIYRGYDGNTNTIGYQVRTNSGNLVASDTGYRYRIWLTEADGKKWVPINTSTSTNSTTARTLNTRPIDPFGPIVYRATNGTCSAGAGVGATGIWQQYTLTIGYSYVVTLTYPAPVYLRCTPQSNGSAVMNDITQTLPSTNDGKIYIFLGTAYSATNMELQIEHPVYWHDGTALRLWTGAVDSGGDVTMTEAEVDAAVEAAWPVTDYEVTVNLTNPQHQSYYGSVRVYESETGSVDAGGNYEEGTNLGTVPSADGSLAVEVNSSLYGLVLSLSGSWLAPSSGTITTSGEVTMIGRHDTSILLKVDGDGTVTIDGIEWYDD